MLFQYCKSKTQLKHLKQVVHWPGHHHVPRNFRDKSQEAFALYRLHNWIKYKAPLNGLLVWKPGLTCCLRKLNLMLKRTAKCSAARDLWSVRIYLNCWRQLRRMFRWSSPTENQRKGQQKPQSVSLAGIFIISSSLIRLIWIKSDEKGKWKFHPSLLHATFSYFTHNSAAISGKRGYLFWSAITILGRSGHSEWWSTWTIRQQYVGKWLSF